ncbi:retention module-containing protein, partial [Aquipseudomonas ullengensis]
MSTVVAVVKSVVGQVFALSPEGIQRLLIEGDRLFRGDQVQTGQEGMVSLQLQDGQNLEIGQGSQWVATAETSEKQPAAPTPPSDEDLSVNQLQEAIAAGMDPTAELEATAAGPGSSGGGGAGGVGGGHSFVLLGETGEQLDPTIGFQTAGLANGDAPQDVLEVAAQDFNTPPPAATFTVETDEDVPYGGKLVIVDGNGDPLTYDLIDAPDNGQLVFNPDGSWLYTPNPDYNGPDSFQVQVSDGQGGQSTLVVNIGVRPINDAPTISVSANDFTENSAAANQVAATYVTSDEDGDNLTVSFTGTSNSAGYYALVGGQVVLTAAGAAHVNAGNALPTINLTVTDNGTPSLSATASDTPAVTTVNDAPTIAVSANDFTENSAAAGQVAATYVTSDEDGDNLTVSFTGTSNSAGYYALVGGQVVLTAAGAAHVNAGNALPTVNLTVTDNGTPSLSATASDTPAVTTVNDAPTIAVSANDFTEESAAAGQVAATYVTSDEDGDSLTVSFTGTSNSAGYYALVGGQVVLTAAGAAHVNGGNALPTVNLTVTDNGTPSLSGANSDTPVVTLVNDAPVAVNDSLSTSEDTPVTFTAAQLTGNDTDEEGSPLTINSVTSGNGGTAVLNIDGTVTFTPNANFNGTADFTYTVTDGQLTSNTATVNVAVAAVNDAPVAGNDSITTNEDTPVTGNLLTNDSDVDGDNLSVTQFSISGLPFTFNAGSTATIPFVGRLTVASNGEFTFTPGTNYNGPVPQFTYTLSDGTLTDTATLNISINAVNDAPVNGVPGAQSVNEDGSLRLNGSNRVSVGDVDSPNLSTTLSVEHGVLTIGAFPGLTITGSGTDSITLSGNQILINIALNNLRYAPDANYNGADQLTIVTTDSAGLTDTDTVAITVNPINDAPVAVNDSLSATEDTPVTFTAAQLTGNDTDVEGSPLTINSVTSGNGGTAVLNIDGTVTFTPNANFNGTADFTYTVTDGQLTSNTATVNVAVAAVNDAPVAGNDSITTNEDTPITGNLLTNDSDVDGDSLSVTQFSISGLPFTFAAGSTATIPFVGRLTVASNGEFTFTPGTNYNGPVPQFTYTLSDGTLTDTATLNISINAVNDAPVNAMPGALSVNEDGSLQLDGGKHVGLTDIDSQTLSTTLSVEHGVLTIGWFPGITISGSGTDSVTLFGNKLLLNLALNNLHYAPDANYNGADSLTVTTTDSDGLSDTDTVAITVNPVNDAPVAVNDSLSATEDTSVIFTVAQLTGNDSDADGTPLIINSVTSGNGGTAVLNSNGTVTFTPNANFNGTANFTYTVTDGQLTSNTATVNVVVAAVNDAPVANDDAATSDENLSVTIAVLSNDTDAENNTLTVTGVTQGANGSVVIDAVSGNPIYTPNGGFSGSDSFTYTISDGNSGTSTATVNITVNPKNDVPVAVTDSITLSEGGTATILVGGATSVLANDSDADGDPLTATLVTGPTNGSLTLNANGTFSYTHNGSETTSDSFTYKVNDGSVDGNTVTVNIGVTPVNDAPVANDDFYTINEDQTLVLPLPLNELVTNDTDADGDSLRAYMISGASNGSFSVVGSNVVFTPTPGFSGAASFTYGIYDGKGGTSTATVHITVNPVNDAPVAVTDSISVSEGGTATILASGATSVLTNDSDAESDPLTATLVTGPANGTLTLNADGTFSYTHNGSETTTDSFTYKVNDGTVDGNTVTVNIGVTPINDAPVAVADSTTVAEGSSVLINLAINDTDVDGTIDPTSIVITGNPANGSVTVNADGTVSYQHNGSDTTNDTFTYTIKDNTGAVSNPVTVSLTITAVDDAPTITVTANDFTEDSGVAVGAVAGTYTTADAEGDARTV